MTRRWAAILAPACVAIALHLPALACDFVFDDRGVVLDNPWMGDLALAPRLLTAPWWTTAHAGANLYRPLTSLSFAIDHAVAGGFRPAYFHLINVLLHGVATALVAGLALEVWGTPLAAAVAGGVFAVHPVHVESVAGIVGRAEILAACGVLSAILLHRRALRRAGAGGAGCAAGAAGAAGLAMLAKESAFVTPLLAALVEFAHPPSTPARGRRAVLYGGYALAALAALGLRAAALGGLGLGAPIPFVDNPAASAGPWLGRLTALACVPRLAGLLLWPARLSADYSYNQIPVAHGLSGVVVAGAILAAGVVGIGVWFLRRRPGLGIALLFAPASLLLTSNLLFFIGTLVAERLLYLPSVAVALLAAGLVSAGPRSGARRVALAGAATLVLLGAGRTWTRLPDWKDDFSLYRSAARVSPRSARIRYNLGNAYLRQGRPDAAEGEYREALRIYDRFGDARANLGLALLQEGKAQEASGVLEEAAALLPANAEVRVNLGSAWRALGRPDRAEAAFREALQSDDRSATAWNNLGSLQLQRGDAGAAVVSLEAAVRCDPRFALYRVNLGDALRAAGRSEEAFREFEAAARFDDSNPEVRRALGEAALERGELEAAERDFEAALAGRPPSARAANFLGFLAAQKGDARRAAAFYERAVSLDPGLADAEKSLGILYAGPLRDSVRARAHLERSLALDPRQPEADRLRSLLEGLGTGTGAAPGSGDRGR